MVPTWTTKIPCRKKGLGSNNCKFGDLCKRLSLDMNGRVTVVHFASRGRIGNVLGFPGAWQTRSTEHWDLCSSRQASTLLSANVQGAYYHHAAPVFCHGPLHDNLKYSKFFSGIAPDMKPIAQIPDLNQTDVLTAVDDLKQLMESKSPCTRQQIDLVLERLENQRIQPSFECLYLAIECYCRIKRKGSEERIEELFQQLRHSFRNVVDATKSRHQLQVAMMHTLRAYHHVSNAHRAEELLLQFAEDLDDRSLVSLEMCKSVLTTWSRSDSSRRANRAEKLLSIMGKDEALPDPDITCYTLVLNCWASSNKENAPRRAELLLRSLELNEDVRIRPNMMSYTCVLNAWARSQHIDAPSHAERLFREMRETKGWTPDRVVYNAMISTWGRSKGPKSILKAEEYFQQLKDLEQGEHDQSGDSASRESSRKATVVEYSALIQAWANFVGDNVGESRRAVVRVEELLDELMGKYFDSNDRGAHGAEMFRPNRMTFASVFRAIHAARRVPNRGDRAQSVLQKMHKVQLEPNAHILGLIEKCTRSGSSSSPERPNSKVHDKDESKRHRRQMVDKR